MSTHDRSVPFLAAILKWALCVCFAALLSILNLEPQSKTVKAAEDQQSAESDPQNKKASAGQQSTPELANGQVQWIDQDDPLDANIDFVLAIDPRSAIILAQHGNETNDDTSSSDDFPSSFTISVSSNGEKVMTSSSLPQLD